MLPAQDLHHEPKKKVIGSISIVMRSAADENGIGSHD